MVRQPKAHIQPGEETEAALYRFSGLLIRATAGLAFMAALLWCLNLGYRWLTSSSLFALKKIYVAEGERLARRDILALSGIREGENIFAIDIREASKRIESHPWVESALIKRIPLDRISISVVERSPIAAVQLGKAYYLIDSKGNLFQKIEGPPPSNYILIAGLTRDELERADGLTMELLWKALDLVSELRRPVWGGVSRIDIDKQSGLTLRILGGRLAVRLGRQDHSRRLDRLEMVLGYITRKGILDRVGYVDLRYRGMAVVGMDGRGPGRGSKSG